MPICGVSYILRHSKHNQVVLMAQDLEGPASGHNRPFRIFEQSCKMTFSSTGNLEIDEI
jgi:hypothetical protein